MCPMIVGKRGHELEREHINIYGRVWRKERKRRNGASQKQSLNKSEKKYFQIELMNTA